MAVRRNREFTMSIEPYEGPVYQWGFHLGTDEKVARQLVEERFKGLNSHGNPTRTIALMKGRVVVDVYDASGWSSERGFEGE